MKGEPAAAEIDDAGRVVPEEDGAPEAVVDSTRAQRGRGQPRLYLVALARIVRLGQEGPQDVPVLENAL